MPILGMQNLNAEVVEYIQKNHKRIAVEKIAPSFAKDLKLKYPDDARAVIDYQAINHILKEHKNLSFEDIANYRELSKQANETLKLKDNQNRPVVASFNQINGFFVVVEQVSNAKNELMLKTMYKARGNYKDSLIYKKTLAKSQNSNWTSVMSWVLDIFDKANVFWNDKTKIWISQGERNAVIWKMAKRNRGL